jgi:hypothetical protein
MVTSQSVADQLDVALALRVISLVPVVPDRQLNRLLNILVAHRRPSSPIQGVQHLSSPAQIRRC